MACVERQRPPNEFTGSAAPLWPRACRTLSQWRQYKEASVGQAGTSQPLEDLLDTLVSACEQEDNIRTGDQLMARGRYAEALTFYIRVPKMNDRFAIPELSERARHGAAHAALLQNTVVAPPPEVIALERSGRFDDAYRAVVQVRPEADAHRKNLGALLRSMDAVRSLERRGDYEGAQKRLSDQLTSLDPERDVELTAYAYREIERLQARSIAAGDVEADSLIAAGDLQVKRGDFAGAVGTYDSIQTKKRASVLKLEAANSKAAEARRRLAAEPTVMGQGTAFLASLPQTIVRLTAIVPYVVSYALLIFVPLGLIGAVKRVVPAREDIRLELTDQTTMGSVGANASATDQMRREMALPRSDSSGFHVEVAQDAGGSSLGHVSLAVPLSAVETAFTASSAVAFGPLSINPLQLFQLLRQFCRRLHRYELVGSVSTSGSDTACVVTIDRQPRRARLAHQRWEAVGSGTDARTQAVRAVAMQILVDLDPSARAITHDWRSLNALREGLALAAGPALDMPTRQQRWQSARAAFQDAVLTDPGNWLARFNLGTVLRKLGANSSAAEQFRELLDSPRLPAEYREAVKYNLAAALQKTDDDRLAEEALHNLDEVLSQSEAGSTLHRLALSGKMATWADRLARRRIVMRRSHQTNPDAARFLAAVDKWRIEALATLAATERDIATASDHGEDDNVVLAVLLNAAGQLEALSDRAIEGRDHYRRAIALLPSFVEPRLNLASLYIARKGSLDAKWATRVERLLRDVQALDETNIRSMVLLGELYSHDIFGRIDEAKRQLTLALPDPQAARRLGSLLLDQRDPGVAIAPLKSAASQEPRDGMSNFLLALCALALDRSDARRCHLLGNAERWLVSQTAEDSGVARFTRVLRDVRAARAECSNGSDNAAAQTPIGDVATNAVEELPHS